MRAQFARVRPDPLAGEPASADAEGALVDLVAMSLGRREVLLTHSGTGALFLLLRLLAEAQPDEPEVVIPALCCPAVYYAARAAGCKVVLADSLAEDGNLDPASAVGCLSARTVAVVAVYLYGRRPPAEAIRSLLARRGIALIEDAAQALGARPAWQGAVTVVSFGRGKILSAGGGGALATDDSRLAARLRDLLARLRRYTPAAGELRRLCPPLAPWGAGGREPWARVEWALSHAPRALDWLLAQPMTVGQVARARSRWPSLPGRVAQRGQAARLYRNLLADSPVQVLGEDDATDAVWRLPVLLPDGRRRAMAARSLLAQGIFPVTLYEPLHHLVADVRCAASLAVAEDIGSRVLALDVSPGVKDSHLALTARILRQAAERHRQVSPTQR
ncbi:MAG: DegT/DnrJ/EryC1/StrS aminotransferase family protein [Anaerolineae bacterium]|nr:DegT/DnrJ/EryC1/StrS aminotransferase family protein [Anaerolineae bacterium]